MANSSYDTAHISKSLLELVNTFADKIPISKLNEASALLERGIAKESSPCITCVQECLTINALVVAMDVCRAYKSVDKELNRKMSWQRLQEACAGLQTPIPTESNALSIAIVFCCFTFMDSDASNAAASALSSTIVTKNTPLQEVGYEIATHVLRALLVNAASSSHLSLHTIVHFAKAFNLDDANWHCTELSANVMRRVLCLDQNDKDMIPEKRAVNGALALACRFHPWPLVQPAVLVDSALSFDFWLSAEAVCMKAHVSALSPRSEPIENDSRLADSVAAVEFLIDAAIEGKLYRLADKIATNLYDCGGKSRYVEARLLHACDTIAKVVAKRKLSIIEQQVERVGRAVELASDTSGAVDRVRTFALEQLEMADEIEEAHRFATMWNLDYVYDEKLAAAAAAARRQKYLQWDDVLSGSIPELLSTPEALLIAYDTFRNGEYEFGPFGFDAEWVDDSDGAAVLQLAHPHKVLLIDIPALSSTFSGVAALRDTVGKLMSCSRSVVVGFGCRQDLSRLRSSPCVGNTHWLSETDAVVDAQQFIADQDPALGHLGLSRVSEVCIGKPLDKSEQCSLWCRRPLSERQRVYAALDAWICASLHKKFFPTWTSQANAHG